MAKSAGNESVRGVSPVGPVLVFLEYSRYHWKWYKLNCKLVLARNSMTPPAWRAQRSSAICVMADWRGHEKRTRTTSIPFLIFTTSSFPLTFEPERQIG